MIKINELLYVYLSCQWKSCTRIERVNEKLIIKKRRAKDDTSSVLDEI